MCQSTSNRIMSRGFTLIEMLVSVALFTVVMVVALGALLNLSEANRKADTVSAAVNNLSAALDDMSRTIRTGTNYHCGYTGSAITSSQDCSASPGQNYFAFLSATGEEVVYRHNGTPSDLLNGNTCGQIVSPVGCIERSTDGGHTWLPLTSADVVVTNLTFYTIGSPLGDNLQPRVTILISGHVSSTNLQQSDFNIETSVTQSLYDQ